MADAGPGIPRTIRVVGNGTSAITVQLDPGVTFQVQSVLANLDAAAASVQPTLTIDDQSGVVIAKRRQASAVTGGAAGTATWALRLDDEGSGTPAPPAGSIIGATVARDANQSIAGNTTALISWDTLVNDTSGGTFWAAGTPTQLKAPSAGLYLLTAQVFYFKVAGSTLEMQGGAFANTDLVPRMKEPPGITAGTEVELTFAHVLPMQAGDYAFVEGQVTGPNAIVLSNPGAGVTFYTFATWTQLA